MTSPDSVGSVSIEIVGEIKGLAKKIREQVQSAIKDLDLNKAIRDSVGSKPIRVPVEADLDPNAIPEKVRRTRVPKVPVELDPLMVAFQQQVRRETATLSRQALKIPVEGDAGKLRSELGAQLKAVQAQSRITVPTEPGDKLAYETRLRAQLAEVAHRVKQTVNVDVDVDKGSTGGRGGGAFGAITNLLKGFTSGLPSLGRFSLGLTDITESVQKLGGSSAQAGGQVAGAFTSAAGPIGALVAAVSVAVAGFAALTTGAALAVPVLGAVAAGLIAAAGAAAAIPGALAGAGAVFGTLSLGFKGITDAFKPKARGGGGGGSADDPAARARRVAAAERGVEQARRGIDAATRGVQTAERGYQTALLAEEQAQARVKKAQESVNQARRDAVEDIDDLNRALRGAQLDQEDATLAVSDALRNLNAVKLTGNIPDIQRANLEYEKAQLALENAKDSTQDLTAEQADSAKKGVEGSDKVQNALQDQADAIQAVKDAQNGVVDAQNAIKSANDGLASSYDSLKSAQDSLLDAQKKAAAGSSGGGALGQVVKLAPEARKFVDAIKALKPAFEGLRLDVQNRLFKDLDKTVTNLGNAWIPALRTTLGSYADTFNTFFRDLGSSITQPKFISDLQAGAEGARTGLAKVGNAITTSLVPAFGALSRAAGPFLDKLGGEIAKVVTKFSEWVLEGEKTGKLRSFFDKATEAMHDLFTTGKLVTTIIGSLFKIIFNGDGKKGSKSGIDTFNDGLRKLSDWLADPENQKSIQKFIADMKDLAKKFLDLAKKVDGILDKIFPADGKNSEKANSLGVTIGEALVAGIIAGILSSVQVQTGILQDAFIGPNSIVGRINSWLGIQSPSTVMMETGRNLVAGIISGIQGKLKALFDKAKTIRDKVVEGVGNTTATLLQKGKDLAGGVISGLGAKFTDVKTKASQLKTKAGDGLSNAGQTLYGKGQQFVLGLISGLTSYYKTLSTYAGYAKAYIQNGLSKAGSFLYDHGRAVINGLINGISSKLNSLGSFLNRIGTFIQNNKGPIEKDRMLLFGAGQAIMGSLIRGIDDKRSALASQLSDVSALVEGTSFPDLGSGADAAITRSLSVADSRTLQAEWRPGATGDPVLDALRSLIKFRHNGDAMAALST